MSPERSRWSDDDDELYRTDPRRIVGPPAIALIVVGALGFAGNCATFSALRQLAKNRPPTEPPPNMTPQEREGAEMGRRMTPAIDACLFGVPTIVVYGLVFAGGITMQRLQNRGLAITAAILAVLPCGPAILVGLPVGIWAAVVLSKPEVIEAFARSARRRRRRREDW